MKTEIDQPELPRLLYLSDVVVESSFHGSALIYRLLQNYPTDRLLILQPSGVKGADCRRLENVAYAKVPFGSHQLSHSRLSRFYRTWLALTGKYAAKRVRETCNTFRPEAVLTVMHGFSWMAAAEFARQEKLPLFAIVHDDWPRFCGALPMFGDYLDRVFGKALRLATMTFCVSPNMLETYQNKYAARGCLLYPSQAVRKSVVNPVEGRSDAGLSIAFAGTINSEGYAELLRSVAACLKPGKERLLLFGPHSKASLRRWKLDVETIENRGLIDSDNIGLHLAREADVLLVPMSFADYEKENMRLGFPSKIAEYAATGIPMLIVGPEYCSAVRWARENESVAEIVTSQDLDSLSNALERLKSAPHREMLGQRALEVGKKMFSHAAVESIFFGGLTNAR